MLEGLSSLTKVKWLIYGIVKIQTQIFWFGVPTPSIFLHSLAHTTPNTHPSLPIPFPLQATSPKFKPPPCALCPSAQGLSLKRALSLPGRSRRAILWGLTWVIWELSPEPLSLSGLASRMWTSLMGNSMDSRAQLSFSRFSFRLQRGVPRGRACKIGARHKALWSKLWALFLLPAGLADSQ